MIKLVAFDWNGCLLSDAKACWEASNQNLMSFGLQPISLTRFRQTFKIPAANFYVANGFQQNFLKRNAKTLSRIFIEAYEPRANKCRTRAGVREILNWLKTQNIQAIIFSNHTRDSIIKHLKRLGLTQLISFVIGHNVKSGSHYKNMHINFKEAHLLRRLKALSIQSQQTLLVGDTEEEIDIGRKHGSPAAAITGGYNTTQRLKKHKPDFLIHNMLELKKIIEKLNK